MGKLYEVQKYLSMTRHTYGTQFAMFSPKWFDSLDKSNQQLMKKAHRVALESVRGLIQVMETNNLDILAQKGMKINEIPAETLKEMREAGQGAYVELLSEKNIDKVWIDKALKASAEAEAIVRERQSKF